MNSTIINCYKTYLQIYNIRNELTGFTLWYLANYEAYQFPYLEIDAIQEIYFKDWRN